MRVLLLNYEYPPYGGGAGVASESLARTLASRGVTVDVVTAGEAPSCESSVLWDGEASERGRLNVHHVRCRRTSVHEAGMGDSASYLVAALPELVQHGRNGLLIPPRDPLALAAAIHQLGENPTLRSQISRRNRADAEATLSWDRIGARYLSLYHGIRQRVPGQSRLAELPSS